MVVDERNFNNINNGQIAYMSCDKSEGSVSTDDMLNAVMARQPTSIVLYSKQGQCCWLDGKQLVYSSIYTMSAVDDSVSLNFTANEDQLTATIQGSSDIRPDSDNDDDTAPDRPDQAAQTSAAAMSAVYSITGLITLLFFGVLLLGVMRARRFPHLYGPRPAMGSEPRQSRARGIARAVLDTLPIIKFGEPRSSGDPERGLAALKLGSQTQTTLPTIREEEDGEEQMQQRAQEHQERLQKAQGKGLTGAAAPPLLLASEKAGVGGAGLPEDLGCSICTDDFLVGEDLRVLPCDHKFHPSCVDPWLINVSGTCPLW